MSHFDPPFNVLFSSDDPDSVMLSNLAAAPFWLDFTRCASVEGFLMAVMFPQDDPRHAQALQMTGRPAKRMGREAKRDFVYWYGRVLPFGSDAHEALIERAIRAKFEQNRLFMGALRRTRGKRLVHDVDHPASPRTCLRREVFCNILTRLRDDLLPRWPMGTDEHPLRVKVRELPYGGGFQSWLEDAHGEGYWRATAADSGECVFKTLQLFAGVHERITIEIEFVEHAPR